MFFHLLTLDWIIMFLEFHLSHFHAVLAVIGWETTLTCRILKVQYTFCFWHFYSPLGLLSEHDTEQFEYDSECSNFSTFFVSPIPFHSNVKECKDAEVVITVSVYIL